MGRGDRARCRFGLVVPGRMGGMLIRFGLMRLLFLRVGRREGESGFFCFGV